MGGDALFNQVRPKIKCEQSYGTNSSDESGSFSEGDSESCHVQEQGPEVSVKHGLFLVTLNVTITLNPTLANYITVTYLSRSTLAVIKSSSN